VIVEDCVCEHGELAVAYSALVDLNPIGTETITLEILAFAARTSMGDSDDDESSLIILQGFVMIVVMLFMTVLDISLSRRYIHLVIPRGGASGTLWLFCS
jgi:uncharacterized membrane protein YjgN (DUF898 family)